MFALLLCSYIGCQNRAVDRNSQFRALFNGFDLVLVDDLPANTPIFNLDSSVLRNTHPGEQTLTPGRVYVFRKASGISNEILGKEILPERLARMDARVTKAPKSSKDFMYPFIGGPLFVIGFEKDGHQGTIFNRVHTSPKPAEQWEELIVAYE